MARCCVDRDRSSRFNLFAIIGRLMGWRCPACDHPIQSDDLRRDVVYRCSTCKLEFVIDEEGRLSLRPLRESGEELTIFAPAEKLAETGRPKRSSRHKDSRQAVADTTPHRQGQTSRAKTRAYKKTL